MALSSITSEVLNSPIGDKLYFDSAVEPQHRPALQQACEALRASWNSTITIKPLKGGLSGDFLYHLSLDNHGYAVRIVHVQFDPLVSCTKFASDHGFGAKYLYWDSKTSTLATEFIKGTPLDFRSLADPQMIDQLATHLKTLHQSSLQLSPFDQFEKIHARLEKNRPLHPDLWLETLSEKIGSIQKLLASCKFPQTPCHNDITTNNLFYESGKIKIIDWGDAGLGDPFYDLAMAAIQFNLSPEQNRLLLERYLGQSPGKADQTRFYLLKQIVLVRAGLAFLHETDQPLDDCVVQRLDVCRKNGILKIPSGAHLSLPLHSKEAARWIFDTFLENTRSDEFSLAMTHA